MKIIKNTTNLEKQSGKEVINNITVLFLIYVQYSLWFFEYSATVRIILSVMLCVVAFIVNKEYQLTLSKNIFYLYIILIMLQLFSCLLNGILLEIELYTLCSMTLAILLIILMPKEKIYTYYCNAIVFLAWIGTALYALSVIEPSLFVNFPILSNQAWTPLPIRNAYFCAINLTSRFKRNFGIFYEPGLFAFHLNLALYLQLFMLKKVIPKNIIILTIALITTLSTNGMITYALIVLSFIANKQGLSTKRSSKLMKVMILIFAVVMAVLYSYLPDYFSFLTSKLSELNGKSTSGSGFERFRAMQFAIQAIKENPVSGVATIGWSKITSGSIGTFTPLNWFAYYGIFYGVLCNWMFFRTARLNKGTVFSEIIQICALFTLIISQNVSAYLIVFVIIFHNAGSIVVSGGKVKTWSEN